MVVILGSNSGKDIHLFIKIPFIMKHKVSINQKVLENKLNELYSILVVVNTIAVKNNNDQQLLSIANLTDAALTKNDNIIF